MFIFKTDLQGDRLWSQTYGAENSDFGYGICQVPGGFVVCRKTDFPGPGSAGWIIITDNEGEKKWEQKNGE